MDRKEAIEVIKKNYPHVRISGSEFETALRELVPELHEREDERIRKYIIKNEDIDKVAQELYEHLYELKRRNNVPTNLYDKQEIIDLWKAGIEYGRNHPKQEQPEVDLEKEIEEQINMYYNECEKKLNQMSDDDTDIGFLTLNNFARHFYELGLNARKEE